MVNFPALCRIRVYSCPSVVKLLKALCLKGFLDGWTATVNETVSNAESRSTICHYLSELAETLPLLAFTHAVEAGLVTQFEQTSYRTKIPALNPSFEGAHAAAALCSVGRQADSERTASCPGVGPGALLESASRWMRTGRRLADASTSN